MGQVLKSKGVTLTVPLRDGRRVPLTPADPPVPADQVSEQLLRLLRNGDEYASAYMELVDDGMETIPASSDSSVAEEVPEIDAQDATSDAEPSEDGDSDDGGGEEPDPIDWDAVASMNADELVDQLEALRDGDDEDRKSFDRIVAWERDNKARKTVLRIAEGAE